MSTLTLSMILICLLSAPSRHQVLLVCSMASMEGIHVWSYVGWQDPAIVGLFLLCVLIGCAMNFTTLHCTYINSAITTSFVGVVKSIATITVGMLAFSDVQPTQLFVAGVVVNTLGSVIYCCVKYAETRHKSAYDDLEETQEAGSPTGPPYQEKGLSNGSGPPADVTTSGTPPGGGGGAAGVGTKPEENGGVGVDGEGLSWETEKRGDSGVGDSGGVALPEMTEAEITEMQREHLQKERPVSSSAPGQILGDSCAGVMRSVKQMQFLRKEPGLIDNMEQQSP